MLAKRFLTNVSVARDFLKANSSQDVSGRCNFATLKIIATSSIEEDMRARLKQGRAGHVLIYEAVLAE